MWCRNVEGYRDYTAGIAVSRASKKERKEDKNMAKKRSCRRSTDESKVHEKAVKVRKMTDEQLVKYIENRVAKAKSEGYNEGKKKGHDLGYLMGSKETVDKLKLHSKEGGYLD